MNEKSKQWFYWAIPAVVVLGLGAALYYGRQRQAAVMPTQAQTAPEQPASAVPPIHNPINDEAPVGSEPLPLLADSDAPLQQSLSGLFGRSLSNFLVPKSIIRHFVVTIDNLPRKKTAVQMWPVKPTPGAFGATGTEQLTLDAANYARYEPIIKLVQSADARQAATLYRRYYPLFQQAYVDLGYPEGYFNDRLVEVIDHLLQTPEVPGPVSLVQPGVFYQYADPTLEERSSGQKLLLRMGPDNAAALKLRLRELRREIAKEPER
jgi:hypothetical protein